MSRKILVTGAAGFIGFHLARNLLEKTDYEVIGIDNFNNYYDVNLKKDRMENLNGLARKLDKKSFTMHDIDLTNYVSLNKLFLDEEPDVICHLAAQAGVRYSIEMPHSYVSNNITATLNLLEACSKNDVKEFIFASTSSVYGLSDAMPYNEDTSINSIISTYSSTKRACELLCHTYNNLYGINFRILRFFTVYGPWGRPDMALFLFTKAIFEGKPIKVFNDGKMLRDFTYIDDIIEGFLASIENNFSFEIFNLGTGRTVQLLDYITELEKTIGKTAKKIFLPMQKGDVPETWADISKAKKMLNYNPQTKLHEGIKMFVEWYLEYYKPINFK